VYDGDCLVKIEHFPDGKDIHAIELKLDNVRLTTGPARRKGGLVEMEVSDPLHEGTQIQVALLDGGAGTTANTVVQQALQVHDPPGKCRIEPRDDREVFEASGYVGTAFDNFAPSPGGVQSPDPGSHMRFLAGVEAQYRLVGKKHDSFQLWIGTFTLHGVRSAEVKCPGSPLCTGGPIPTGQSFFAVLEDATSIEAHFDVRVEMATLQKDSELPIKVFALGRFGFTSLSNDAATAVDGTTVSVAAPKVMEQDMLGGGILSPAGPFKGSNAAVGWGKSDRFQSHPGWNRLKVNGTLIFDVMPGFKDRLQFWKRLAGSPRAFISISVDRNPSGPAPDAVNTYVGVDVDLRRIFFGLGG